MNRIKVNVRASKENRKRKGVTNIQTKDENGHGVLGTISQTSGPPPGAWARRALHEDEARESVEGGHESKGHTHPA